MSGSEAELVPQPHGGALRKGGGRPTGAKTKVIKALREALIDPDTNGVIPSLIKKAKAGDVRAIELCLQYGIGKPKDTVEVSGLQGGPILLSPVLARLTDEELGERVKQLEAEVGQDDV